MVPVVLYLCLCLEVEGVFFFFFGSRSGGSLEHMHLGFHGDAHLLDDAVPRGPHQDLFCFCYPWQNPRLAVFIGHVLRDFAFESED